MGLMLHANAPQELSMPALSPTMSQGNLASWAVQEGAEIAAGDVLAEIETDKATLTWDMQVQHCKPHLLRCSYDRLALRDWGTASLA